MTTLLAPRPAPIFHSAIAAAFASLSIATGRPCRSRIRSRRSTSSSGTFTEAMGPAGALVDAGRDPDAERTPSGSGSATPRHRRPARRAAPPGTRRSCRPLEPRLDRTLRRDDRNEGLRPSDVDADDSAQPCAPRAATVATIRRRMASPGGEKPYRLYRGGREGPGANGRRPESRRPGASARTGRRERLPRPGPEASHSPRRGRSAGAARSAIALVLVVLFFVVWTVLGYLTVRSGVSDCQQAACRRRPRRVLAPDKGSLLSNSTHDPPARHRPFGRGLAQRRPPLRLDHAPAHRSRSRAALLPLDPSRPPRRRSPATATSKINTAFQIGGPRLAIRTVSRVHDDAGQPRRGRQLRRVPAI